MKNYETKVVQSQFRNVVYNGDVYYYLKDILDYYGYSRHWWKDHRDKVLDRKCKVIKHSCAKYGMNHKGNFVNWFLLNRLVTIFIFQDITGVKNVDTAKVLVDATGGKYTLEIAKLVGCDATVDDVYRVTREYIESVEADNIISFEGRDVK